MASSNINYKSLTRENALQTTDNDTEINNDNEDTPHESGVMIHIVPETSRARWNHIEDLDSFFSRMYTYHQKHGFLVILLDELFQLCEFGFVIWLFTFFVHCIQHSYLFGNSIPQESLDKNITKVGLSDVILPMGQCFNNFGAKTFFILFLSSLYFVIRLFRMIYHITHYADIKKFYNTALHIEDNDLDNITWHDVQKKIREVQVEQHMCIDKENLTELDIYHRILRFKNYMVALMNKNLLPVRFHLPFVGECVTLSRGLLFNIDLILFRGPGSPFQNNWQLRDEYIIRGNQVELAQRLSRLILYIGIVNLILSPIIFLWQLIYFSFAYANILRKEPSALGLRTWSNYGRLYLRHFNELEHELDARLNRAYDYSDKYLSSFSSPLLTVIAKNILFISGGLLVVILALGIYDEFVFQVEHVLTIITALSAIGLVCRSLIPDENLIWCPEQLMTAILAHVHYLPPDWKNQAHTTKVRKEFSNFFQFKAGYLLNEIASPIVTPFLLIFVFRPKSLEIVKFFRSFTVTVRGVGNVCSFAQMDVRKHGNTEWNLEGSTEESGSGNVTEENKKNSKAEHGKTELSLIRFTLTNPEWHMPSEAKNFINKMRKNAADDFLRIAEIQDVPNALKESLISFGTIGEEFTSIATCTNASNNVLQQMLSNSLTVSLQANESNEKDMKAETSEQQGREFKQMLQQNLGGPLSLSSSIQKTQSSRNMRKMRIAKAEGRLQGPSEALLYNLHAIDPLMVRNPMNVTVADMCLSTLYLHELYKQKRKSRTQTVEDANPGSSTQQHNIVSSSPGENTPLLGSLRL